jgi:hypothetical protein
MNDAEKEPIIENAVEAVKILQAIGFGTRNRFSAVSSSPCSLFRRRETWYTGLLEAR